MCEKNKVKSQKKNQGDYKKITENTPYEYRHKNPYQNISKLNLAMYKKE